MLETRGREKERPDGGQGSGDAGDAPNGKQFGGNYSLLALLLIVHTRRIGLASGTAKT
jgi:hypothetical protein